jgi:ADP-heptose:LPS heptosyltransferase
MVERYLELLAPLGIDNPAIDFGLVEDAPARQWVHRWLNDIGLAGPFAVINPGAGWDSKRWPTQRLAKVANHLGQRWNLPTIVVWAGSRERAWADQIVALAPEHALLAPATSLMQLMELLRRARLMIASDTGPLHLAAAVGAPCLGLFGTTSREACGPYGEGCVSLQRAWDRSRWRKRPGADNWAVREITVEMAQLACDELLSKSPTAQNGFLPVDWGLRPNSNPASLPWPYRAA